MILHAISHAYLRWREARIHRREARIRRALFVDLLRYDDRMLADMGYERDAVKWAASLPLDQNAAAEAAARSKRSREQSRNRRPVSAASVSPKSAEASCGAC